MGLDNTLCTRGRAPTRANLLMKVVRRFIHESSGSQLCGTTKGVHMGFNSTLAATLGAVFCMAACADDPGYPLADGVNRIPREGAPDGASEPKAPADTGSGGPQSGERERADAGLLPNCARGARAGCTDAQDFCEAYAEACGFGDKRFKDRDQCQQVFAQLDRDERRCVVDELADAFDKGGKHCEAAAGRKKPCK